MSIGTATLRFPSNERTLHRDTPQSDYRQLEKGFVIHSVAQNLVDGGGAEADNMAYGWRNGDLTYTVEREN